VPAESPSFLIDVESADRQAARTSLWTCSGNDPSARLIHRLSRMAREVGLLRSDEQMPGTVTRVPVARVAARLGGRCGTWSGRRTPLPAADRRRAGHRPRGKPNLGVEGHLARDLRQPDPLPDQACRGLVDTADQLIAAGQAAEHQPRSHARKNKRNGPGRTRHWSNASQTSRCQPIGGVLQPARKKCDPRRARPMVHMQEFGGCPVTRAADPLS
jgi:hypothetical protein